MIVVLFSIPLVICAGGAYRREIASAEGSGRRTERMPHFSGLNPLASNSLQNTHELLQSLRSKNPKYLPGKKRGAVGASGTSQEPGDEKDPSEEIVSLSLSR